ILARPTSAQLAPPGSGFEKGWNTSDTLEHYGPDQLFAYIDGGAEQYLELGFVNLKVQRYANGKSELELNLYRMDSPEAALGIYLITCPVEKPLKNLQVRNSGSNSQVNLVRGPYFVQINNSTGDKSASSAMTALAKALTLTLPNDTSIPLLDRLPKNDLIAGSVRIFRGPLTLGPIYNFGTGDPLQLASKTFGIAGGYADGQGACIRMVIPYPDSESAKAAFSDLLGQLDIRLTVISKTDHSFMFKDDGGKFGQVARKESIISATVDLANQPPTAD
ncbi:MAG TPA: DUF6599 family protein, partial [Candidatus Acidoferrum sp.]|nr:DUF6599 family protein [Candidatus Acidoferrum sp.]